MAGTPFEPMPDELTGLRAFLRAQRATILEKSAGLTDEQATSHPTVSDFCMLTLVKHVAYVERRWMFNGVDGRGIEGLWPPADPEEELRIDPGDTIESVRSFYESIVAENEAIEARLTDLDSVNEYGLNTRWILLHLIEELARHAGHADLIRESLDGSKGV